MSGDTTRGDGMGVSSEREGPTGPGQHGTDGVRYTGPTAPRGEVPPEQSTGAPEIRPETPGDTAAGPPATKAGYPSLDPRSKQHRYVPGPSQGRTR